MPSVEPLSTTTVSVPLQALEALLEPGQRVVGDDDDRRSVSHARPRAGSAARALPQQDRAARERERDGDEEEQEAGRERRVGIDPDAARGS